MLALFLGHPTTPPHSGDSPNNFDEIEEPSGTYIVNDKDSPDLDIYQFTDDREYQVTVNIPITRYVGNINDAIAKGTVSKTAQLFIPAFDVDADTKPTFDCDGDRVDETFKPEVNEVYFNGELLGTLTGNNQKWKFNDKFSISIEKVNFPSAPGEVATNEVGIIIDTANKDAPLSGGGTGCKVWATTIDWVGLQFDAAQPVFLLAGFGGDTGSLDNSGYTNKIKQDVGIYAKTFGHSTFGNIGACDASKLPAIRDHADELLEQFITEGQMIGATEFHLVGHSMGGLDGRMILQTLDDAQEPITIKVGEMGGQDVLKDIKIKSLMTHSSPHHGSLIADYLLTGLAGNFLDFINDGCELTTETWRDATNVLSNTKNSAKIVTIGADADFDPVNVHGAPLTDTELSGNSIEDHYWGNLFYKILRDFNKIEVDFVFSSGTDPFPHLIKKLVHFFPDPPDPDAPNENDTLVTVKSAHGIQGTSLTFSDGKGKNHGTIINTEVQNESIPLAQSALGWGELK